MINTSTEYKNYIMEDRKFHVKANITLVDSTLFQLTDDEILQNGMSFDDAVSDSTSLQVGAAIIGKHTISINNEGEFDEADFTGAAIVPFVGLELSSSTEYLRKGTYTVDESRFIGDIIILECLDNMHKFEKPFSEITISFPCTANQLLSKICLDCGVVLATPTLPNGSYSIIERPNDEAISCLDMVSYIAQINGCFARCNTLGALEMKWYDLTVFEGENHYDGGVYDGDTPYSTGNNIDGGNFSNYTSGNSADGGTFLHTNKYHHIHTVSSTPTVAVDDVVITGISVEMVKEESEPYTYLSGASGYVLTISNNPLIQSESQVQSVANFLGNRIIGMRFRPFSASSLSDPSYEAGDPVYLPVRTSRGINTYQSYITSLHYTVGQRMEVRCDAETPSRNSSTRYSAETKTQVEARKLVKAEKNARELAMEQLQQIIENSSGLYPTEVTLPDNSKIYYFHDKPTLAESLIVWKLTAQAFAISVDGGLTYPTGITADGDAILQRLYAIDVDCSLLKTGIIRSTNGDSLIDLSLGVVNADNFQATDNIENNYPLKIPFNIDSNVSVITKVELKWTQDKFRTYSKGTSSGGGTSTTSESAIVYSTTSTFNGSRGTGLGGEQNGTTGSKSALSGESHNHTFNILGHSHYTDISHTHGVVNDAHSHTVSVPSHSHGVNYGILDTPITNNTITIYVDGVLRATKTDLQGIIDLSPWITTPGWHEIQIQSTSLKRVSAQVNIKSYIRR